MKNPLPRLVLAAALVAAWLTLLLCGFALGGGVHLLLVGAAAVLPWRQVAS